VGSRRITCRQLTSEISQVLFDLARYHAPSTIFLDEVDALMGARGGEGEHEASRRMKTEILVQLDGLAASSEQVFLLAASNLPWELDMVRHRPAASHWSPECRPWDRPAQISFYATSCTPTAAALSQASCSTYSWHVRFEHRLAADRLRPFGVWQAMLRRLEKRILVPLPDEGSRADMFSSLLAGRTAPEVSFADMAACAQGFSGSDVRVASKEAAMRPLRRLMLQLEGCSIAAAAVTKLEVRMLCT
jgi:SpoVK/Ycf46/Vps4 family AAA+-type ATPase